MGLASVSLVLGWVVLVPSSSIRVGMTWVGPVRPLSVGGESVGEGAPGAGASADVHALHVKVRCGGGVGRGVRVEVGHGGRDEGFCGQGQRGESARSGDGTYVQARKGDAKTDGEARIADGKACKEGGHRSRLLTYTRPPSRLPGSLP